MVVFILGSQPAVIAAAKSPLRSDSKPTSGTASFFRKALGNFPPDRAAGPSSNAAHALGPSAASQLAPLASLTHGAQQRQADP